MEDYWTTTITATGNDTDPKCLIIIDINAKYLHSEIVLHLRSWCQRCLRRSEKVNKLQPKCVYAALHHGPECWYKMTNCHQWGRHVPTLRNPTPSGFSLTAKNTSRIWTSIWYHPRCRHSQASASQNTKHPRHWFHLTQRRRTVWYFQDERDQLCRQGGRSSGKDRWIMKMLLEIRDLETAGNKELSLFFQSCCFCVSFCPSLAWGIMLVQVCRPGEVWCHRAAGSHRGSAAGHFFLITGDLRSSSWLPTPGVKSSI